MSKDTSGPAFPCETWHPEREPEERIVFNPGMTYRQWLAGLAMQMKFGASGTSIEFDKMAKLCFQMADAMIAEDNKQ